MYKIETHLHTKHTSKCGKLTYDSLIDTYKEKGYDAIAVTDHYNAATIKYKSIDIQSPGSKVDYFLEGYDRMKEEGEKVGIIVYMGMELRFSQNENDYLLYGFEKELLANPKEIMDMGIVEFSKLAREKGAVIVQAHPFRKKCVPIDPIYLDGVEVLNANPRHNSHNDLAYEYGKRYNLPMTAGSDCHRVGDEGLTGIQSSFLPKDTFEFAELICSRNYKILTIEDNKIENKAR